MKLNQTINKHQLIKNGVYRLYHKGVKRQLAVFCHLGQTGMPIFHPLGEPSFQDVFALRNYEDNWVAIFERDGTRDDLGY
jgi:hypothetical protein